MTTAQTERKVRNTICSWLQQCFNSQLAIFFLTVALLSTIPKKNPSKKDLKFGEAHYSKIDQNYCQNQITPILELLPKRSGRRIRIRIRTRTRRRTEKGCCYYVFQDCVFLSRNQPRGGDGWLIKSFLPPHPLFLSKESAFVPCLLKELLLWMSVLRHNDRVSWKVKWLLFTVTEHRTGR